MDERLQRLKRLTSAMATRKRAYELRLAQVNGRIASLSAEQTSLLSAASAPGEPFPGANLHYVKRLEAIARQLRQQENELRQLTLLHLKSAADLKRSQIISQREVEAADRLRENRYLEHVIDVSLTSRTG